MADGPKSAHEPHVAPLPADASMSQRLKHLIKSYGVVRTRRLPHFLRARLRRRLRRRQPPRRRVCLVQSLPVPVQWSQT